MEQNTILRQSLLKDKTKEMPGFQYVVDQLELMSTIGRRLLMEQPWQTNPIDLATEWKRIERITQILNDDESARHLATIKHKLMVLHDIATTLQSLHAHGTLNEVELFEIKHLSLLCMEAYQAACQIGLQPVESEQINQIKKVFELLDPDHTGIANFYIYDSYHPELGPLRKKLKALQNPSNESAVHDDSLFNDLFNQQSKIEELVIAKITNQLYPFADVLATALKQMAYADILIAKATQAVVWNLTQPQIVSTGVDSCMQHFKSLWNPRLRHRNEDLGLRYQSVDIDIQPGVCLITGANMAGKTVLLKTLGVAQLMAQFGMYIPATEATITLVDDVVFCIGDEQNEMNGLSSFASEIIKISNTVKQSQTEHLLILIDEPARTTNPIEGKAIVQAISHCLDSQPSTTLITTHYSQLGLHCRRLRVKGFVENLSDAPLTPQNINLFMDYSLLPDDSDDVPQEALRIATILGCDNTLIERAKLFMK